MGLGTYRPGRTTSPQSWCKVPCIRRLLGVPRTVCVIMPSLAIRRGSSHKPPCTPLSSLSLTGRSRAVQYPEYPFAWRGGWRTRMWNRSNSMEFEVIFPLNPAVCCGGWIRYKPYFTTINDLKDVVPRSVNLWLGWLVEKEAGSRWAWRISICGVPWPCDWFTGWGKNFRALSKPSIGTPYIYLVIYT